MKVFYFIMHDYRTISSLTNSFEITALDSNTSYTAWVKVDSVDYGASDWSDSINFVTNELLVVFNKLGTQ